MAIWKSKTVLSSTVIEALRATGKDCIVLHFYFAFNDKAKQKLEDLIRSLVIQLGSLRDDWQKLLEVLFFTYSDGRRLPSCDELCSLQAASFKGHNEIVEMLLASGAIFEEQRGHYGNALQAASFQRHNRVVEMLLANGADVNAQSGLCGTALQAASFKRHNRVVEMLLAKGANANARSRRYGTALQASSSGGHDKIVEIFLEGQY